MRLWTQQSPRAWETLQKSGLLHADGRLADHFFRPAYRWLAEQMRERLGPPPRGVRYPLWAFRTRSGSTTPPRKWTGSSKPEVAIVFDAPDDDVLLSDFDLWHCVLNRWYIPSSMRDLRDVDDAAEIERSWVRIFAIGKRNPYGCANGGCVQACLWELRLDQVRRAYPLTPRAR